MISLLISSPCLVTWFRSYIIYFRHQQKESEEKPDGAEEGGEKNDTDVVEGHNGAANEEERNESALDENKSADDTGSHSQVPMELQKSHDSEMANDEFRELEKHSDSQVSMTIRGKPIPFR